MAISAVLNVMAEVRTTSGKRKDRHQVRTDGIAYYGYMLIADESTVTSRMALVLRQRPYARRYSPACLRARMFASFSVTHVHTLECSTVQVSSKGRRPLETKLLKVYVKLLARILRDYEKDSYGANEQGPDE